MLNAFSSANYPTTEPGILEIGDRWAWKISDIGSEYPPADYALSYEARQYASPSVTFGITAGESGSEYVVEVASATTATYRPGVYMWASYITRSSDSERVQLREGVWTLRSNLATDGGTDVRSHARRTLDAIQAAIEGRATREDASYSIEGVAVTHMTPEELMRFRGHYQFLVNCEIAAQRVREGKKSNATMRARMR